MAKKNESKIYKKFLLFIIGFFILVLGITLILVWFEQVAILFKGASGFILALGGLLMLYGLNKQ